MKRIFVWIAGLLLSLSASAQVVDDSLSTQPLNERLIQQVERLAEESDEETDYSDLIDSYIFFSENPININSDEISNLLEIRLISIFQLESLKEYQKLYGEFLFIEELEMVEGFDAQTIAILKPIVYVGKNEEKQKITMEKLSKYGKHQIIGKYEQILEQSQGYEQISDSALLASQNSGYLGSPQRYYLKYAYNYRNKVRAGFAMEKDPGELFFFDHVSDTISSLLGKQYRRGFDFYGFHLFASDLGMVKRVALGDYQLSFGQGLTLWSGMSFGKTVDGSSVMKQSGGIRPSTSANEANYLRGAAVTVRLSKANATLFYSSKNLDANITSADSLDDVEMVSSLQGTGYHRTIGEIQDRHAIRESLFGGHLSYDINTFEIGYTIHHTMLSAELVLTPTYFNQFYFQGKALTNQGLDFKYVLKKFAFFGEASMSDNGALAGLVGFSARPTGYINFSALYRNYDKRYQNLLSNAFGESSRNQGEEGIYLGLQASPAPHWALLAYADLFRFKWLTSQVYAPSHGHDYYLNIDHQINKKASFYFRLRSKTKMKNSSLDEIFTHEAIYYTKRSARFCINYSIGDHFNLKYIAEYVSYSDGDKNASNGYYISQDINYKPIGRPFSLSFRYSLFDTESYDSRIYAYENDVLYAFSVPALSGKGMRVYLLAKMKVLNALSLYAKIGRTMYSNVDEIGSGLTLIQGNHKTDLKVEAIWKL